MQREEDRVQPVNQGAGYDAPPKSPGLKAFIPTAIVSLLICVGLLYTGWVPSVYATKADLTASVQSETASAKAAATDALNKASTAIQSAQSLASSAATKDSVAAVQRSVDTLKIPDVTALNGQINTATSKVDSLTKQVADDQTNIKTLQTQIASLQTQITALSNGTSNGGVATTGTVKAVFSTSNWVPTYYTPSNITPTFQLPFKLTITNGLNKQITNLQLFVSMYASGNVPGATGVTLQSLSGGTWSTYTSSANTFYFTNSSGMSSWGGTSLTIPANSSTAMTLIFNYTAPVAAYGTVISFSPDIAPISSSDYTVG